jgi:transposase
VEAVWHHRRPVSGPSRTLRARRGAVSTAVRARARAADARLHHRWTTLQARTKRPTVIAVAVARELAGWCWSMAVMDP